MGRKATLASGNLPIGLPNSELKGAVPIFPLRAIGKFSTDFDFVMAPVPGLMGEGFYFCRGVGRAVNALGSSGAGLGYAASGNSGRGSSSTNTGNRRGGSIPPESTSGARCRRFPGDHVLSGGINLHGGHFFHARLSYERNQP